MKSISTNLILASLFLSTAYSNDGKTFDRYLSHIFQKYGDGRSISFEGLEHLLHSLRLGGLEFSSSHTIAEHHEDGYVIPKIQFEQNVDLKINDKIDLNKSTNLSNLQIDMKRKDVNFQNDAVSDESTNTKDNDKETIMSLSSEMDPLQRAFNIFPASNIANSGHWNKIFFREMHDIKNRHPRHHHANKPSSTECLSPSTIMKLLITEQEILSQMDETIVEKRRKRHIHEVEYNETEPETESETETKEHVIMHTVKITPATFLKLCPALLVQIDQDACAQKLSHSSSEGIIVGKMNLISAWIYASIAILIISCCGLFGLIIEPLARSVAYYETLKFLVAMAVGTLCGDALMHLLPHALISHNETNISSSHEREHEAVLICGCAFLTALMMYCLETLIPLLRGDNSHHHHHSHHHQTNNKDDNKNYQDTSKNVKEANVMLNETELDKKGSKRLSPVAFMVILGDSIHNVTDGLAIGAAFAADPVTGMATAFAVLCHELPHELGDFALLLKTGVSMKRALLLNIISSILSFMGMGIGLVIVGVHTDMVRWIYAGTAGSFLYIALADLLPEMGKDGKQDAKNALIQIIGIFLGGAIMLLIAFQEDNLRYLFE